MNADTFRGKWEQIKGSLKETWGDLTDQDFEKMKGGFEQAIGHLQEKYGESKEAVKDKLSSIVSKFENKEKRHEEDAE